jgi:hypothetical protein
VAANIHFDQNKMHIGIKGVHKILSFKSQLEIPLEQIKHVERDQEACKKWCKGIRAPGINIPNLITAGTFYKDGEKIFWDVTNPDNTIIIHLKDNEFSKLIIEVSNPNEVIKQVNKYVPVPKV